jgi:cytochrome c peroxidase
MEKRLVIGWLALLCVAAITAACSHSAPAGLRNPIADSFYAGTLEHRPSIPQLTELGRRLFADPLLSASGRMACTSCHDPRRAYGPANALAVQPGGVDMQSSGLRAAPSLRYLQNVPPFNEHYFDEATDESVDQGPVGGHTWDGRADTVHDQARLPLMSPQEMANGSADEVAARVTARYGVELQTLFGAQILVHPERVFDAVLLTLEVFQQNPADFYPYSSRYDGWLRGKLKLKPQELRGLMLFNDAAKGNCASCHPSQIRSGAFPQFTDFGYAAIAVPRNRDLPVNRDAQYFDMGLCGPVRRDLRQHGEYCGLFRVPSLRNVALRRAFFHNGVMHSLQQVVEFYAQREAEPQKWYGSDAAGRARYDDLPEVHFGNVNREPPFNRRPEQKAALSTAEIRDIVAFLGTLTDADQLSRK